MIVGIFETIGDIVGQFALSLRDIFDEAIGIVWTGSSLSNVGILLLLGLGTGLLIWGFKFIRRLIRVRTN